MGKPQMRLPFLYPKINILKKSFHGLLLSSRRRKRKPFLIPYWRNLRFVILRKKKRRLVYEEN